MSRPGTHLTPQTFTFRARVYGIMDGAVYLSGRTGATDDTAVSVMVPLDGERPQLGDEVRVWLRVGQP